MMKNAVLMLSFITLVLSIYVFAHSPYKLSGRIVDETGAGIPGLNLVFKSGEKTVNTTTDSGGNFSVTLEPGDHEITADEAPKSSFRAFIKVSENDLNPQDVEFRILSSDVCNADNRTDFGQILSSAIPTYPAAARAIRASGTVIVEVTVNSGGSVIYANAISGHPLLRAASKVAAEKFIFSPQSDGRERKVNLRFIFGVDNEPNIKGKVLSCPTRFFIAEPTDVILTSTSG